MDLPKFPWYGKLKEIVAPTEDIANIFLIILILITIWILIKGSPVAKAAWLVYMISP